MHDIEKRTCGNWNNPVWTASFRHFAHKESFCDICGQINPANP